MQSCLAEEGKLGINESYSQIWYIIFLLGRILKKFPLITARLKLKYGLGKPSDQLLPLINSCCVSPNLSALHWRRAVVPHGPHQYDHFYEQP